MMAHYMQKLRCSRCGKGLWKKHARMIDGKVMCSACLFAPAKVDGRPKGRDSLPGSGSADQRGAPQGAFAQIPDNPKDSA